MTVYYVYRSAYLLSLASVFTASLSGCAIHPLPEDVTGVKTSQIVHRNRCEARDALQQISRRFVLKHEQLKLNQLKKIGVVLSYSLDMTESDSVGITSSFENMFSTGNVTFNPNAGNALTRENLRTFTVADNYQTLQEMKFCDGEGAEAYYQYPIVGKVGIEESVRTFLTMSLHEDLNGADDATKPSNDPSKDTGASPTMVETLTFTTVVNAGVTPSVSLTPVANLTRLTGATLPLSWSRNDKHQVIVGIGMPTVTETEVETESGRRTLVAYSTLSQMRSAARARTPLLIDAAVPKDTGPSTGTALALEAVNDQIVRFQTFRPTVVIAP